MPEKVTYSIGGATRVADSAGPKVLDFSARFSLSHEKITQLLKPDLSMSFRKKG